MKKKLKNDIYNSFINETPDRLSSIKNECKNIRQKEIVLEKERKSGFVTFKRLAFTMIAIFTFTLGYFVGNNKTPVNVDASEATIYLDVNPSIEIEIGKHHIVKECKAGNEDGEKILENIQLKGVEINTALYAIVGSMYTNGYLNEETNSILVSVDNLNENNEILLDEISVQINNVFKENEDMNCSIIAQKVEKEELKELAEQYGVSIGKIKLIQKIIEKGDIYTEENIEELTQMSIHELNLIYQSIMKPNEDENDDVVTGKPEGFIEKDNALEYVKSYLEITDEDIEWSEIFALYHHNDKHEREMVYIVTLKLIDSESFEKYIVNCSTGEIMPDETVDEWKDKFEDFDFGFGHENGNGNHGKDDDHDEHNDKDDWPDKNHK